MSAAEVLAFDEYKNNGELIAAAARLGYLPLDDDALILDATYGKGTFWANLTPTNLYAHDLDPDKAPDGPMDFRDLEYADQSFDAVVFDPPYKLEGTSHEPEFADRYGLDTKMRWQDIMALCRDGVAECARVVKRGGWLLVKCQDQVCSGKVRWQTREFADVAIERGFRHVTSLHIHSRPRPQHGKQKHPRNNYSTLLILKRERA